MNTYDTSAASAPRPTLLAEPLLLVVVVENATSNCMKKVNTSSSNKLQERLELMRNIVGRSVGYSFCLFPFKKMSMPTTTRCINIKRQSSAVLGVPPLWLCMISLALICYPPSVYSYESPRRRSEQTRNGESKRRGLQVPQDDDDTYPTFGPTTSPESPTLGGTTGYPVPVASTSKPTLAVPEPTPSKAVEGSQNYVDAGNINNYCGKDYMEAYTSCWMACPNGNDDECSTLGVGFACQEFTLCYERITDGFIPTPPSGRFITTTIIATDVPSKQPTESPVAQTQPTSTAATTAATIAFPSCPDEYATNADYTLGNLVAFPIPGSSTKEVYECRGEHCNAGPGHAPGSDNAPMTWTLRGTCDSSTVEPTQGANSSTAAARPGKWFPDPGGEVAACTYGNYYPNDYPLLFDSEEECCKKYPNLCNPTNNATIPSSFGDTTIQPTKPPSTNTRTPTPTGLPTYNPIEETYWPTSSASIIIDGRICFLFGIATFFMALLF